MVKLCKFCNFEIENEPHSIKYHRKCSETAYKIKHKQYIKENPKILYEIGRRHRIKNKEVLSLKKKEYRIKNKDKIREHLAEYRKENHEELLTKKREYYSKKENLDKKDDYMKNYLNDPAVKLQRREYNKIFGKIYRKTPMGMIVDLKKNAKRRSNIKKVIHNFTPEQLFNKILATGGFCENCGDKFIARDFCKRMTVDHNPALCKVSEGFVYKIENIRIICQSCNSSKRDRPVEELCVN